MLRWSDQGFRLMGAIQNGADLQAHDSQYTVRGEWDAMGGGVALSEGAYGAPNEAALTLGAAYTDDQSGSEGAAFAVDAAFTSNDLSIQAEVVDYEDDYTALDIANGVILPSEAAAGRGDTTPWSVTVSHLLGNEDQYEATVRYEDFDDGFERNLLSVGASWYLSGHDAKLLFNFTTEDSLGPDVDLFLLGAVVSF